MASQKRDDSDRAHLRGIADGCGCAEIWEHLSEERERTAQQSER